VRRATHEYISKSRSQLWAHRAAGPQSSHLPALCQGLHCPSSHAPRDPRSHASALPVFAPFRFVACSARSARPRGRRRSPEMCVWTSLLLPSSLAGFACFVFGSACCLFAFVRSVLFRALWCHRGPSARSTRPAALACARYVLDRMQGIQWCWCAIATHVGAVQCCRPRALFPT
jgi:hypothetical protein